MKCCTLAGIFLTTGLFLFSQSVNAQEKPKEAKPVRKTASKETVLKAMHVEAHIEKPSVSIVPKRIKPELKEVEFIRRSFSKEIKNVPRQLLYLEMKNSKKRQVAEARRMLKKKRK